MRQQSGELTLAPATNAVVAVASAARAAISVIAGLGFTCGVAALIWAITPSSGASPVQLLRGGVAAYALAHFAPVDIGAVGLSLSPMFLTALFVAMLVGSIGRGDAVPRTATDELAGIAIGTLTYAVMVGLLVGWLATPGSVNPLVGVCAGGVALVSLTVGTVIRGEALRELLVTQLPRWFIVAARSAVITVMSVVGAAAVVLVGSLAFSLGTAATLTDATTSGVGDEIGLTLVGLAYLPNAMAAAVGYITGVGFDVGSANFSPFGSVQADLPPLPILAALPTSSSWSAAGLTMLLIPVIAAVFAGIAVTRAVWTRRERLYSIGVAAALAALALGLLVGVAGGGVAVGAWSAIGAPAWRVAAVIFLVVLVVGGSWTAAAGGAQIAWKPQAVVIEVESPDPELAEPDETTPDETTPDETPPGETTPDETSELVEPVEALSEETGDETPVKEPLDETIELSAERVETAADKTADVTPAEIAAAEIAAAESSAEDSEEPAGEAATNPPTHPGIAIPNAAD